ncbi:unnamed protein product [Lota lota]
MNPLNQTLLDLGTWEPVEDHSHQHSDDDFLVTGLQFTATQWEPATTFNGSSIAVMGRGDLGDSLASVTGDTPRYRAPLP